MTLHCLHKTLFIHQRCANMEVEEIEEEEKREGGNRTLERISASNYKSIQDTYNNSQALLAKKLYESIGSCLSQLFYTVC